MNQLGSIHTLTEVFIKEYTQFDDLQAYYAAYDLRGDVLDGVSATVLAAFDDPIIPAGTMSRYHIRLTSILPSTAVIPPTSKTGAQKVG